MENGFIATQERETENVYNFVNICISLICDSKLQQLLYQLIISIVDMIHIPALN